MRGRAGGPLVYMNEGLLAWSTIKLILKPGLVSNTDGRGLMEEDERPSKVGTSGVADETVGYHWLPRPKS